MNVQMVSASSNCNDYEKQIPKHNKTQQQAEKITHKKEILLKRQLLGQQQSSQGIPEGQSSSYGEQQGNTCDGHLNMGKLYKCYNDYCPQDKKTSSGSLPSGQEETRRVSSQSSGSKQLRLENTGERVSFCDHCGTRYQDKHFCFFCQQVYFDDQNIDEKSWIQCDSCDHWHHLHCEDHKIQKAFNKATSEDLQYECARCRNINRPQNVPPMLSKVAKNRETNNEKMAINKSKKFLKIQDKIDKKSNQQENDTNQCTGSPILSAHTETKCNSKRKNSDGGGGQSSVEIEKVHSQSLKNNLTNVIAYYSIDNFKKNNNNNRLQGAAEIPPSYQYKYPPPLHGYSTLEDLLKGLGLNLAVEDSLIKQDLFELKKLITDNESSLMQSSSSTSCFQFRSSQQQ